MQDAELRTRVRTVIRSAWRNYPELAEVDRGYLSRGVTSLDLMDLILRLEEEFHIEFSDDHLGLERFESLDSICATVREAEANK